MYFDFCFEKKNCTQAILKTLFIICILGIGDRLREDLPSLCIFFTKFRQIIIAIKKIIKKIYDFRFRMEPTIFFT